MTDHGYEVFDDPYCYKGTFVLKNRAGIRDPARLEAFELEMSSLRAEEQLPNGRFGPAHYRSIHRHLFGDVYTWAGRDRTVRTAKGGNAFCYPENIDNEMRRLFPRLQQSPFNKKVDKAVFVAAAADFLGELNAIHAFREGNGRAQLAFMRLVSLRAGYPIDLTRLRDREFLSAMISSFGGKLDPLQKEIARMIV